MNVQKPGSMFLTYRYPAQSNPNIQTIVSSKREFNELRLTAEPEEVPARGEFYKQQILQARYMLTYDFFLVYNEPGTGKTGSMFHIADTLLASKNRDPVSAYLRGQPNFITRIVILTSNSSIADRFRSEYYKYSKTSSRLPEGIEIYSHEVFKNMSEKEQVFTNNTAYLIDEPQFLLERSHIKPFTVQPDPTSTDPSNPYHSFPDKYKFYYAGFRSVNNIKLGLFTGSTIIEHNIEIVYLLNFNPASTMLADPELFADTPGREARLAQFFNGKISYVRATSGKAIPIYPEESKKLTTLYKDLRLSEGQDDINVVVLPMSTTQTAEYMSVIKARKSGPGSLQVDAPGADVPEERRASLFATDKSRGISLNKARKLQITNEGERALSDKAYLAKITTKMRYVLDTLPARGKAVLVFSAVTVGTTFAAEVLLSNGYTRLELPKNPRGRQPKNQKEPLDDLLPAKRFAVITGESTDIDRILRFINADKNLHGEYVQLILFSPAGSVS